MIIRATKKLLNTSRIASIKNLDDLKTEMPGEWYASTISLLQPGKLAIHFLHYPTFISILIPGKSLNKVIPSLGPRTSALLSRLGYSKLEPKFKLDSQAEIFATNNRSILGNITQMKFNIEYHIALADSIESIDYDRIEDIHFGMLFTDKTRSKGFVTPEEILHNLLAQE